MEEKNKNESSKNLISFFDGTVVALLISAALFSLSYAYNGGYNYYFGIPQMFTNSSWGGIVYRMPQISEIILLIAAMITIIIYANRFIQYKKASAIKNEFRREINQWTFFLIFSLLFVLYDAYQFLVSGTILTLAALILMIALVAYAIVSIRSTKKLLKELKERGVNLDNGIDNIDLNSINDTDLKKARDSMKNIMSFMKILPSIKPIIFSSSLALYTCLFILTFLWGSTFAEKQTVFYCIDEHSIVTSTFGSNVVTAAIEFDAEKGQYFITGYYSIISQDNLKFYIKQLGKIKSKIKQDEIQINFHIFRQNG